MILFDMEPEDASSIEMKIYDSRVLTYLDVFIVIGTLAHALH
jgi:hypothetical protein